nr:uncharacterized protein LOC111517139 [Leptinotarsa decemlineata]
MSGNISVPYVLEWKENGLHLREVEDSKNTDKFAQICFLPNATKDGQQLYVQSVVPVEIEDLNTLSVSESPANYVFEVVQTQPNVEAIQPTTPPVLNFKRGRPKKKKDRVTNSVTSKETNHKDQAKVQKQDQAKVPKLAHRTRSGRVVKIPKHIVNDFEKLETNDNKNTDVKTTEFPKFLEPPTESKPSRVQGLEFHQQRRTIAAQYRCPKCRKAYLGKTKMMQHIQKHPDHGPMPQNEKKANFDVWNFLVDITQKCPQAQRGAKFCEELTNLMHNLLLLTSALFKKVELNKNFVEVDKVLGNAIGLKPGPYCFNDNELYKDVTVLQLLTTTDFFKPSDDSGKPPKENVKVAEAVGEPIESVAEINPETAYLEVETKDASKDSPDQCIPKTKPDLTPELKIPPEVAVEKNETPHIDSEMLSDNSILHLSNIRTSVDELMMTSVDTGGTLLDNSTSSDEVMNVDQFVNERFKKITEPDVEMNSATLNLDLPSLDLFQFHTS